MSGCCYNRSLTKELLIWHKQISSSSGWLPVVWNYDCSEASRCISIYVRSYLSATIDTNLTCGDFHESVALHKSHKRRQPTAGLYLQSPSSSTTNNGNLIDLLNNAGEDKASHRGILGEFNWRKIQ